MIIVGSGYAECQARLRASMSFEFHVCGFQISPCHVQIVVRLKIYPKLRTIAKVHAQPECGVGGDAPPIIDDLGDAVRGDADRLRKLICDKPYSTRNSSFSISPGLTGANSCVRILALLSVVIHDPDPMRLTVEPLENDPRVACSCVRTTE